MSRIGSHGVDATRMAVIGRHIWSFKNRAWSGMIPLSEQRWKEKRLDAPENFDTAAQYLSAVIAAFDYLNRPQVQSNMRETFNLISELWGEFEDLVNAERAKRGGREGHPNKKVNVRKMWTEYMEAHIQVITERAHRWVLVHVNALRGPLIQELRSYRGDSLDFMDAVKWRITDRLHTLAEIAGVADYTILIPMHGYHGYVAPPIPAGVSPALRSARFIDRNRAYGPHMKRVSRIAQFQEIRERAAREGPREHHVADPVSMTRTTLLQIECQNKVRWEIRGEPVEPVPREPWIAGTLRNLESRGVLEKGTGFVVYRLVYGQREDEWRRFREKVDGHMADWGRGQTGSAALKPHLKLYWRDGAALGIPEGDIEAAKKHYLETYDQEDTDVPFHLDSTINKRTFLAVDKPSYDSYATKSYTYEYTTFKPTIPPGDTTGFILAVDPEFNLEEGPDRPDETPGFPGYLRILGSLVWGDLFGMLASQCSILKDLWPLALDHPDRVYAGPVVPLVFKNWRVHNGIRGEMMREVTKYIKAKVEGRPWVPRAEPPTGSQQAQPGPNTAANNNNTRERPRAPPAEPSLFDDPGPLESGPSLADTPDDYAMRTYLMFQFARYLRQRGQHRTAIFVEQAIRARPGELPDMQEIRRRMELEGATDAESPLPPASESGSRGDQPGPGRGGADEGCPMQ
ncbi:uncharacterized protein BDV17DRAFT_283583 [Aspergillus undulatus]|uniref:uncharacterized protein n=1 Tax=Aspergillus undulatus TaxID=1810928 RepID=UPI003CCE4438